MKILRRIQQEITNVLYELRVRTASIKETVSNNVPYVCQFARPEHAELSLKQELKAGEDPHWADTGAISPERYEDWAFTMCGMASFAMALEYFHGKKMLPAILAEDALMAGVYEESKEEISAMKYREFAQWAKKYGINVEIYTRLSTKGIQAALSEGQLVIVSVSPNIRGFDTASKSQKGGHLVLVTGYDLKNNTVSLNNPSGFVSENTQINHTLSLRDFNKFYAGRGLVLEGC